MLVGGTLGWGRSGGGGRLGGKGRRTRGREGGQCRERRCRRCVDGLYLGNVLMQNKKFIIMAEIYNKASIDFEEGYVYVMPRAP